MHIWLRAENRESERRTPLTPLGAKSLIEAGHIVTVETSTHRIFTDKEYIDAGSCISQKEGWMKAPREAFILGLKELPSYSPPLEHRHIFFGHAYKGQVNAASLLDKFRVGGGELLDLEYLRNNENKRAVAFGYWAGYVGTALALMQFGQDPEHDLSRTVQSLLPYTDLARMNEIVGSQLGNKNPSVLIIGARGKCGSGALALCKYFNVCATEWGKEETQILDREVILAHDILINCTLVTHQIEPFLRKADLSISRHLCVISDVSCDQGTKLNPLPIITQNTEWNSPVHQICGENDRSKPIDTIAIDNLASVLPHESSSDFSAALLPFLLEIEDADNVYWRNARSIFKKSIGCIENFEPK